jgi:hypothetical protein
MNKLTLVAIWVILAAISFATINVYAIMQIARQNRKPPKAKPIVIPNMAIEEMERVVHDKNSAIETLIAVIDALIAHHLIEPKKDGKAGKEAKRKLDLIFTMAGHKNMTNELRNDADNRLIEKNPSYAKDFDHARAKR